ncbi:MAG: aldolase catalytic domain-containing protein [Planctomycetota bacterium]
MENGNDEAAAQRWITYRPEIKVIDCTIRDGGLMNDHKFTDEVVKAVYQACVAGGIDYMEIGYRANKELFNVDDFGPWKFSAEEDIRRIVGDKEGATKISIMADAGKCNWKQDIGPASESAVDMVRIASYIHQIPEALDMIKHCVDLGYETTYNLMALSTVNERELEKALELIAKTETGTIYVVDSFGSMYSEETRYFVDKYLGYCKSSGKEVGLHAHNNQQLAYANTIEALVTGANMLDSSMAGLGRGAGNCPTENLIAFLHNPKFKLRPILDCIQNHIYPLKSTMSWGPDIPYMISGVMNQHPRDAMAWNDSDQKDDILAFYDTMME